MIAISSLKIRNLLHKLLAVCYLLLFISGVHVPTFNDSLSINVIVFLLSIRVFALT